MKNRLNTCIACAAILFGALYSSFLSELGAEAELKGEQSRIEANAIRVRKNLPWAIASEIPGWHQGSTCYEYAINYAYRLNNETDARAVILLLGIYDYRNNQLSGHAMVLFFANGQCFLADQNLAPTEFDLNQVDWSKGDMGVAESAWTQHTGEYGLTYAIIHAGYAHGKQEILEDFAPMSEGISKLLGHQTYFPIDYCQD